MNHLLRLYEKYPTRTWNVQYILGNPNYTLEFMELHNFLDNLDDWYNISKNINLTWELINKYIKWNYYMLSKNPVITWKIFKENPYEPWDIYGLICNPNMTWENIQELLLNTEYYKEKLHCEKTFTQTLSCNPNMTLELLRANFDIIYLELGSMWKLPGLSRNPNINWEIINANPNISWDWDELSEHPNITFEIIKNNFDLFKFNKGNSYVKWNMYHVSKNPNITWEIILTNPTFSWDWNGISVNPNITWEIVCEYPDERLGVIFGKHNYWNINQLSLNPNITYEIVHNNIDKLWNFIYISENLFDKHPHLIKKKYQKQVKCWNEVMVKLYFPIFIDCISKN